jgi:hypothetical protein
MRGSTELAAFVTCCWATRLKDPNDPYRSASLLVNVKQRDFESKPFEVVADETCRMRIANVPRPEQGSHAKGAQAAQPLSGAVPRPAERATRALGAPLCLLGPQDKRGARAAVGRCGLAGFAANRPAGHRQPTRRRCEDGGVCKSLPSHSGVAGAAEDLEAAGKLCGGRNWIFASPIRLGRLPYSYTGVCRELSRAATAANLGHLGTQTFRSWLDAVGTAVAVQQKMMRHADIRTTVNFYGDVVTDEMTTAGI